MIGTVNLTMNFGQKMLFENVSMNFDPGRRYGLVGANGSGKSTFLKLVSGDEHPSSGEISIPRGARLGILKQDQFRYEHQRICDVVLQGKPRLWEAMQEKEMLLHKNTDDVEMGHRIAELEEVIAHEDGYFAESQAAEMLSGLGIVAERQQLPMSVLSGGYKLRVLLAQVLFRQPDVLLLDEPNNHLDIISIRWLEGFLINQFQGTLLLVSHDRDFLNNVSTDIVDFDYHTITQYRGNYDDFLQQREMTLELKRKEIESQEKKKAEMQAFVDRFRAKASKARQAQSRVKQIEKMEVQEVKRTTREAPTLAFSIVRPSGKLVLEAKHISKQFGELKVLNDVSFKVHQKDRLAVIGPNGIGKSTLLKILLSRLEQDQGEVEWGYETHTSWFSQDHHEQVSGRITLYDWLYQFDSQATIGTIRGLLGRVLFSGDSVNKPVESLSGGETARLIMARLMLEKSNVLVLDEPTNHLDLEAIIALEEALKAYQGTVLFVSHDRRFVSNLATRVLALTKDEVRDFMGSYDEYLEKYAEDFLDSSQAVKLSKSQAPQVETDSKDKKLAKEGLSYNERKELKRKIAKLEKTVGQQEKEIEQLENKIAQIDQTFGNPDAFFDMKNDEIQRLQRKKHRLEKELETKMQEWESSSLELSEAKKLWE